MDSFPSKLLTTSMILSIDVSYGVLQRLFVKHGNEAG